jgi:hypothetical protein
MMMAWSYVLSKLYVAKEKIEEKLLRPVEDGWMREKKRQLNVKKVEIIESINLATVV